MQIDFEAFEVEQNRDPIHILTKAGVFKSQTLFVLNAAFNCGGYIAGGFARLAASLSFIKILVQEATASTSSEFLDFGDEVVLPPILRFVSDAGYVGAVVDHLDPETRVSWINMSKSPFKMARKGDIDLFFPDMASVRAFIKAIKPLEGTKGFSVAKSKMNVALELGCDDAIRIQAITAFTGTMEDRLRSFDIFNAMVAYTPGRFMIPKGWHELEEQKTLHVVNWTNGYVINRVNKYFNRFNYKLLTESTATSLVKNTVSALTELRALAVEKCGIVDETADGRLKFQLTKYLTSMTNEDLLLLTSILPTSDYRKMTPFSVLRDRSVKFTK